MEESMETKDRITTLVDRLLQQGRAEGRAQGMAEGRAQGMAEAARDLLLKILATRSTATPEANRAKVMACADVDLLWQWVFRVAKEEDLDEIFAE
jgi:flagellar biosynthesis/type III secretory pathway protein FliH